MGRRLRGCSKNQFTWKTAEYTPAKCLVVVLGAVLAVFMSYVGLLSAETLPLATIRLLPEAEVTGTAITLGEIAQIEYHPSQETQQEELDLASLYVGRAPVPGNSRQISLGNIEVRLRQMGVHPSTVELILPPGGVVKVTTATQEVTRVMVTRAVLEHLQEHAGADFYIGVEAGDALPLIAPLGELELRLEALPPRTGTYRMNVGVYVDGHRYRTIQARVQLQPKIPVVVAAIDISAGSMIHAEAVEMVVLESFPPGELYSDPASVIGLETQRPLRQGDPITSKDVKVPILVKAGDVVVIEALSGAISVKTMGVALQSGKLGDLIRVENAESRKEIAAYIVGKGVVRVEVFSGK